MKDNHSFPLTLSFELRLFTESFYKFLNNIPKQYLDKHSESYQEELIAKLLDIGIQLETISSGIQLGVADFVHRDAELSSIEDLKNSCFAILQIFTQAHKSVWVRQVRTCLALPRERAISEKIGMPFLITMTLSSLYKDKVILNNLIKNYNINPLVSEETLSFSHN